MKNLYLFSLNIGGVVFKYLHVSSGVTEAVNEVREIIKDQSKNKGKWNKFYSSLKKNKEQYLLFVEAKESGITYSAGKYRSMLKNLLKNDSTFVLLNPVPKCISYIYHLKVTCSSGVYHLIGRCNDLNNKINTLKASLKKGTCPNLRMQTLYDESSTFNITTKIITSGDIDDEHLSNKEIVLKSQFKKKYGDYYLVSTLKTEASTIETKKKIKSRNSEKYTSKIIKNNPRSRPLTIDGVYYLSIGDAARRLGVSTTTIHYWIRKELREIIVHATESKVIPRRVIIDDIVYPSIDNAHEVTGISKKKLRGLIKGGF